MATAASGAHQGETRKVLLVFVEQSLCWALAQEIPLRLFLFQSGLSNHRHYRPPFHEVCGVSGLQRRPQLGADIQGNFCSPRYPSNKVS